MKTPWFPFDISWSLVGQFYRKNLPQASTEEELQIVLNSLLRVVTIKLKKKSHFLLESQTIEEIIGKFKGYVGNLRPVQKLMLGKERHIKPWNIETLPSWTWLEWTNAIVDFLMLILKD